MQTKWLTLLWLKDPRANGDDLFEIFEVLLKHGLSVRLPPIVFTTYFSRCALL